jgi:putative glutamine amidotransferase
LMKPVIGITPSPSVDVLAHGSFLRYAMSAPYVAAVLAAGGVPVILPPQEGNARTLLKVCDGLLLSGGGDVEPGRYAAGYVHATTYGVSAERDAFELGLMEEAAATDTPVLGICRGIQVFNVALGGTLIQDVATEHEGATSIHHRQHEVGLATEEKGHTVRVVDGTPLKAVFLEDGLGVNSFHHQAIGELASGLVAAAYAPDGIIEAAFVPGQRFMLAVQWHPELMFERHPEQLRPFVALVEAAMARRLVGATG